jgi:dihydroneopterin aldolase
MDIVYIRGLRIDTVIGIFDFEREHRQPVVLDLEMATDIRPSAAIDEIGLTVSYKDVSERLIAFVENSEYQLVETLAEECAALVMNEFSVPWLRLQLGKPQALSRAADVGIIIERGVRQGGVDCG